MRTLAPFTLLLLPTLLIVMVALHVTLSPALVGPAMTAEATLSEANGAGLQEAQQADER
jgi:hypothetical protein